MISSMKKTALKLLLFTLLSFASYGQQSYVRVFVEDVHNYNSASEIDTYIRTKTGVQISRMDHFTGVYLAIFDGNEITKNDFLNWIEELGYYPKCLVSGEHIYGIPMKQMSREICNGSEKEETSVKQ